MLLDAHKVRKSEVKLDKKLWKNAALKVTHCGLIGGNYKKTNKIKIKKNKKSNKKLIT